MAISLAYPSGDQGGYFTRPNDFHLPSRKGGGGCQHPVVMTHPPTSWHRQRNYLSSLIINHFLTAPEAVFWIHNYNSLNPDQNFFDSKSGTVSRSGSRMLIQVSDDQKQKGL